MEKGNFFIARMKKGEVVEFGPLWNVQNELTLKRAAALLIGHFDFIRSEASTLWDIGSGEGGGLSMNDGVTVCINVLRSIFNHLQNVKRVLLGTLDDDELVKLIDPWARKVGKHFASLSPEQMVQFRALRGVQGQTAGTRRVEEAIRRSEPNFDPPGLKEFLEREKAQTTSRAYEEIRKIEQILQATVLGELRNEFGANEEDWWFSGVPKEVRKKVDDRINEEAGKSGGREQNFDLIDYRSIMHSNWPLFEDTLAKGKGSKENRTKWVVEVNELRKRVMHASKGQSLPITEEQLAHLEEIYRWLEGQIGSQIDE